MVKGVLEEHMSSNAVLEKRHQELLATLRSLRPTPASSTGTPKVDSHDMSQLLTVLQERMPPSADLERRHKELLDALRSSQLRGSPARSPALALLGYILLAIGSVACLIAIAWVLLGGGEESTISRKKILAVGTLLGVGTICSLGGVTLLQHLDIQVVFQTGKGGGSSENPSQPGKGGEPSESQDIVMIPHGSVGPFVTGKRSEIENCAQNKSLEAVYRSITDSVVRGNHLLALFVVGSADNRPLAGRLATTYGSNDGLAGARADWVRGQIVSSPSASFPANRVIVTIRGPSKIGADLSNDRLVEVYGLWTETQAVLPSKQR